MRLNKQYSRYRSELEKISLRSVTLRSSRWRAFVTCDLPSGKWHPWGQTCHFDGVNVMSAWVHNPEGSARTPIPVISKKRKNWTPEFTPSRAPPKPHKTVISKERRDWEISYSRSIFGKYYTPEDFRENLWHTEHFRKISYPRSIPEKSLSPEGLLYYFSPYFFTLVQKI
jgi:hypothetical protein